MSRTSDPFALGRQWLAAQQAQLDMAEAWLSSARATHAWQKQAFTAAESLAEGQRQWLALWGIR